MLQVLKPDSGTHKNSTENRKHNQIPSGIQTAARRDFSEDFMKKVFLLIVVSALLTVLGFAQTPTASSNPDQINIKGCLGGSDGHYTVAEDNAGQIFNITISSADLKPHLGQNVKLIVHKAGGAADNSLVVTELNMISEHCTAAAAAPVATVNTPDEAISTPAAAAAATTSGTPSETPNTPAAAAAAPTTAPAGTVSTPGEAVSTPAAAAPATTSGTPSETPSTPAAAAAASTTAPNANVSTPGEAVSTRGAAVQTTRPSARAPKPSATLAAPAETVNTPAAATPAAPVDASSETASTPVDAAATKPAPSARSGSLWMFVSLVVVVLLMSALVPLFNRWRKRRLLAQTSAQNLSFTNEASSDQGKSDEPARRKAA